MKPLLISAALAFCFWFSSATQAMIIMNLEQFPRWFKKAVKKETRVEGESEFNIESLNVAGKLPGNATLQEHEEGFWYYVIDIGTESPVECYTFTTFDGPANSLYAIMENAFNNIPIQYKNTLSGKFNFALDAGVFNGTPYISVDTLYHIGQGKGKLTGLMKGLSAQTGDSLQICIHNELGYRDTFLSVFESYVTAFAEVQGRAAFFESVYKLSVNGIPVGFVRESYATDKDGDIETKKYSSVVFPVDASDLSRADSVVQEWSSPDGVLINAATYSIENSKLGSEYLLEKKEAKWQVTGQLQDMDINNTLEYGGELISGYGNYLAIADLLHSDKDSTQLPMWVPEADPATKLDVKLSKIADNPDANLSFDTGPVVMQFQADQQGVFQKGSLQQAGLTMNMDLIYVQGVPKQP